MMQGPRGDVWDVIVIGLGPAGVACALQARRDGLAVLGVDESEAGGLVPAARRIENLASQPGGISGVALARRLARSLECAGVPTRRARVLGLDTPVEGAGAGAHSARFQLTLDDPRSPGARGETRLACRAVCVATGTAPRDVPAELQAVAGRCHRDVRSLPSALKGQRVLVVGGGDAALDSALSVLDRGGAALVLVRGAQPRAAAHLSRAVEHSAIDLVTSARVCGIKEGAASESLVVDYRQGEGGPAPGAPRRVEVHELLVCVGREPRRELAWPGEGSTSKGLFFAGDVLRPPWQRFIAPAMGDGVRAALEVAEMLRGVPFS